MAPTILYTRVSTTRQALEGESIPAQLAKLRGWAEREGHEVIATFSDLGCTGASMDRPGAQAALALACRTRGSQVAVTSLSRWGRSTAEVLLSCSRLVKAGSSLVSQAEAFDLRTSTGRLLLAVLSAVGTWQLEVQQEATVMTLAHMRRQGQRISGTAPWGWRFDEAGERLVEVAAEQAILSEMQVMRSSGTSFQAIADALNARAVRARLGGPWSGRAVRLVMARLAKLAAA